MGLLWIMVGGWWILVGFVVDHGWGLGDLGWVCGESWLGGWGILVGFVVDHSWGLVDHGWLRRVVIYSERFQHAYDTWSADSSMCLRPETGPFSVFENRLWRSSLLPHARPLKGSADRVGVGDPKLAPAAREAAETAEAQRRLPGRPAAFLSNDFDIVKQKRFQSCKTRAISSLLPHARPRQKRLQFCKTKAISIL